MRAQSGAGALGMALALSLLCPSRAARAQVPYAVIQNFTGSTLSFDIPFIPPDSDGAVGPTQFVEFVNGQYAVYDEATGARLSGITDSTFWSSAGVNLGGVDVSDPRILFDPTVNRWFAAQITLPFDANGNTLPNQFVFGVSDSADALGGWHGFSTATNPGFDTFGDFTQLGLNKDGVFISVNNFPNVGSGPLTVSTLAVNKASLIAGAPVGTIFSNVDPAVTGLTPHPVTDLTGLGGPGLLLGTDANLPSSALFLSQIAGVDAVPPATLIGQPLVLVPPYDAPANGAVQPFGATPLDQGDERFGSNVYRVGNDIWAVHSVDVGGRTGIRWYKLSTSGVLEESGTLTDPNMDLIYPSIAVNSKGVVVIGFTGTGPDTFASSFAFIGRDNGSTVDFGDPVLLKAGLATYEEVDSNGVNRWGDYSATTIDPTNPDIFWTIQEWANTPDPSFGFDRWSTQVTAIAAVPEPGSLAMLAGGVLGVAGPLIRRSRKGIGPRNS